MATNYTKYIFGCYSSRKMDPTTTSAKCNRTLHQPDSSVVGLNLKDTDNLSPSTPKDSYRTRQSKKKF